MRLCLILGSGPHELMGFAEVEPGQSAPRVNTVPQGLKDTTEKRRLLRCLAHLDTPRIKALEPLVTLLLPGRRSAGRRASAQKCFTDQADRVRAGRRHPTSMLESREWKGKKKGCPSVVKNYLPEFLVVDHPPQM
jgi:hypothetical protein